MPTVSPIEMPLLGGALAPFGVLLAVTVTVESDVLLVDDGPCVDAEDSMVDVAISPVEGGPAVEPPSAATASWYWDAVVPVRPVMLKREE